MNNRGVTGLKQLLCGLIVVAVTASALITAEAASGRLYIKAKSNGVVRALGKFHPNRNPRYAAAVRAFGGPNSEREGDGGGTCNVRWSRLGLTIVFANFGGYNACDRRYGRSQYTVMKGKKARVWSTVRGLRVRNGVKRLRRLYPHATHHGRSWWLITGRHPFGCGPKGCPYAVVRATMRHRRVEAFRVWIGGAGE